MLVEIYLPKAVSERIGEQVLVIEGHDEDKSVMPQMAYHKAYEPHIQFLLGLYVRPSTTVLDVGANYGQHTVLFSKLVGPHGNVIAVEASDKNLEFLNKNVVHNHCENVSVFNETVWSRKQVISFTDSDFNAAYSFCQVTDWKESDSRYTSYKHITRPLDEIVSRYTDIDFIKLDIEGAEIEAIKGAKRILSKNPSLLVEINQYTLKNFMGKTPAELIDTITGLGYNALYIYNKSGWQIVSPNTLKALFNAGHILIDALFTKE